MGLMDAFNPEDRVEIKLSDLYRFLNETAEAKAKSCYIENAVNANVPNCYIRSMLDGQEHTENAKWGFHGSGPMFGEEVKDRDN